MANLIEAKYPATDTAAVTITLASLGSSSTLLAGREGAAVSNTSDLDLDKPVTGQITVGTTPTSGTRIEVWAFTPTKVVSGTATWPDTLTGSDAAATLTSDDQKFPSLRLVASLPVNSTTSNRTYPFQGYTLRELFGAMPAQVSFFVAHNTGVALNATGGNHWIHLGRYQNQVV